MERTLNDEIYSLALQTEGKNDVAWAVRDALGWEISDRRYPILTSRLDSLTLKMSTVIRRVSDQHKKWS